jgi:hypothetical protein
MLVKSLNQNCREFSIWRDQIAADTTAGLSRRFMGVQVDFLVLDRTQSRSTNMLSRHDPLPSMEMAISAFLIDAVKSMG